MTFENKKNIIMFMQCNKEEIFKKNHKIVNKITISTLLINICLAFAKLLGGIFGFSKALISDSINSFGDIITSSITLVGSKISTKKPDKDHPFGHERIESVAILIFEMCVIGIAVFMAVDAIQFLLEGNTTVNEIDYLSTIVASICIAIKIGLFVISFINYKKTKSSTLKAQMLDHLLDSIGTTVSLIAIITMKVLQIWWIDSVATLLIVILICFTAIKVIIETIGCLVDRSWTDEKITEIENLVISYSDIKKIDFIKSRKFGDRIYIEMEVSMNKDLTLDYVHNIIEKIHDEIEEKFIEVIHISIHVNPFVD